MDVAGREQPVAARRVAAARPTAAVEPLAAAARRAFDIGAALILLMLTAPVLVLALIAVRLDAGRPLFFGHERLGRYGRPFRCWKLRTMLVGAEHALEQAPGLKARYVANGFKLPLTADPRVTRVGRVLRLSYIDELPQLFNVLAGTMSLIGPRPIVRAELDNYGTAGAELLGVRPGIIGAWTSRGQRRPSYPERAQIELDYVRDRSWRSDLRILLCAVPVVLRGQPEDA